MAIGTLLHYQFNNKLDSSFRFATFRMTSPACHSERGTTEESQRYRLLKSLINLTDSNFRKFLLVFCLRFLEKGNIDLFECQSFDDKMYKACKNYSW